MGHPGRIVWMQTTLGGLCILVFWLISPLQARSALMAAASTVLPGLYYAWVQQRTFNATRLLMHGVLRMLLTATLIGVSIAAVGIEPVSFFATFAIVQLGYFAKPGPKSAGDEGNK